MQKPLNTISNRVELLKLIPKNGVCMELGVFMGDFAEKIFEITQPKKLYLVDIWDKNTYIDTIINNEVVSISGSEALKMTEERLKSGIENGIIEIIVGDRDTAKRRITQKINFIYIDASHENSNVLADLEFANEITTNNAWICGHDYCEIFDSGVPRAVNKFLTKHRIKLDYLTDEEPNKVINRYGQNSNLPPSIAYNSFAIIKNSRYARDLY